MQTMKTYVLKAQDKYFKDKDTLIEASAFPVGSTVVG